MYVPRYVHTGRVYIKQAQELPPKTTLTLHLLTSSSLPFLTIHHKFTMSLRITVVPASTKAGRETIRQLLTAESKAFVRAIYRDPSKAPSEFVQNSNFEAVKGDVGTGAGLDFSNTNTVFYIPPPTYDGTDQGEWATQCAENVKKAIHDAGNVKRLLLFSALGGQHDHGIVCAA